MRDVKGEGAKLGESPLDAADIHELVHQHANSLRTFKLLLWEQPTGKRCLTAPCIL